MARFDVYARIAALPFFPPSRQTSHPKSIPKLIFYIYAYLPLSSSFLYRMTRGEQATGSGRGRSLRVATSICLSMPARDSWINSELFRFYFVDIHVQSDWPQYLSERCLVARSVTDACLCQAPKIYFIRGTWFLAFDSLWSKPLSYEGPPWSATRVLIHSTLR